jgi:hypothetical protein
MLFGTQISNMSTVIDSKSNSCFQFSLSGSSSILAGQLLAIFIFKISLKVGIVSYKLYTFINYKTDYFMNKKQTNKHLK